MNPHGRRVFGLITLTLAAISLGVVVICWFTRQPETAAIFATATIILTTNTGIEFVGAARDERTHNANDR